MPAHTRNTAAFRHSSQRTLMKRVSQVCSPSSRHLHCFYQRSFSKHHIYRGVDWCAHFQSVSPFVPGDCYRISQFALWLIDILPLIEAPAYRGIRFASNLSLLPNCRQNCRLPISQIQGGSRFDIVSSNRQLPADILPRRGVSVRRQP